MLACSDLEKTQDWFEQTTGVRPEFGGVHTGRGTHNALCSLGKRPGGPSDAPLVYLELIAPDPNQPDFDFGSSERFVFPDARNGNGAKLVHWAAHTETLKATCETGRGDGKDWPLAPVFQMEREDPVSKSTLVWSLSVLDSTVPMAQAGGGILPFLIGEPPAPALSAQQAFACTATDCHDALADWEEVIPNGLHPAATTPKGCQLLALQLSHPDVPMVNECLGRVVRRNRYVPRIIHSPSQNRHRSYPAVVDRASVGSLCLRVRSL